MLVPDGDISRSSLSELFVLVNVQEGKGPENLLNEAKALARHEFVELILRAAVLKYVKEAPLLH